MCVMPFSKNNMKRITDHMRYEHGVLHDVKYSVLSCFMDAQARQSIAETLARKHNIDIEIDMDINEMEVPTLQTYNITSVLNKSIESKATLQDFDVHESNIQNETATKLEQIELQKAKIYRILQDDGECKKYTKEDNSSESAICKILEDDSENINWRNYSKGRIKCNLCGISFATKYFFEQHKRTKHKTEDEIFTDILKEESELLLQENVFEDPHIVSMKENSNTDRITTPQSNEHLYFESRENQSKSFEVKELKCKGCERTFTEKYNLKYHMEKGCGNRLMEISRTKEREGLLEEEVFELEKYVSLVLSCKIPKQSPIDSKLECKICGQNLTRRYNLRRHIRMRHAEYILPEIGTSKGRFSCQECDTVFSYKDSLRRHTRKGHLLPNMPETPEIRIPKGRFRCKECDVGFRDNYSLRRHTRGKHPSPNITETLKIRTIKGRFRCEECDAVFSDNYCLRRHRKRKHPSPNMPRFGCEECDSVFYDNYDLRRHTKRKHHSPKMPETPLDKLINNAVVESSDLSGIKAAETVPLLLPSASDIALDEWLRDE